jgi:hypothetical protein
MIGTIIDTEGMEIAVSVSVDGTHVQMTTSGGTQILFPEQAWGLSDLLAHAAREVQINVAEDVIDHNTWWV